MVRLCLVRVLGEAGQQVINDLSKQVEALPGVSRLIWSPEGYKDVVHFAIVLTGDLGRFVEALERAGIVLTVVKSRRAK